uniref:Uncharacterized protein n=1 Tax=Rhizophora mucronata TaxID=61149 RepID=A0A2P2PQQ0_RHIMU
MRSDNVRKPAPTYCFAGIVQVD